MSTWDTFVPCWDCKTRRPRDVMRETRVRRDGAEHTVEVCPRCYSRRQQTLADFALRPASTIGAGRQSAQGSSHEPGEHRGCGR